MDDGEVILEPTQVVRGRWSVAGDIVKKGAAPEMNLEEMAPVIVVVAVEIQDDGDERGDVGDRITKREGGGDGESGWRRGGLAAMAGKCGLAATAGGWKGGLAAGGWKRWLAAGVCHGERRGGPRLRLIP